MVEHRIVAALGDIRAIVFECNECKARVSISPNDLHRPPRQCPLAHAWNWDDEPGRNQARAGAHVDFISGLRRLLEPTLAPHCGFKVYLEFEEPAQPFPGA